MRAVVLRAFGPPERLVIEERPDPRPGPGQAVVSVEFASITFVETQVRAGKPPNPAMLPQRPAVLGNGVGGVVTSVGANVGPDLVGRRVVTTTGGSALVAWSRTSPRNGARWICSMAEPHPLDHDSSQAAPHHPLRPQRRP